jgi:hypothetical protein
MPSIFEIVIGLLLSCLICISLMAVLFFTLFKINTNLFHDEEVKNEKAKID